jgi:hypothetical protein
MSGGNGRGHGAEGDQGSPLSALGREDLMNAYLEAEVGCSSRLFPGISP